MMLVRTVVVAAALAVCIGVVGCTQQAPTGSAPSSSGSNSGGPSGGGSSPAASSSPGGDGTTAPSHTPAPDPIAGLSLEQRVGQLFMVGTKATTAEAGTLADITGRHVGNIFLSGRSYGGVAATAAVVAKLRARVGAASTGGLPLLVATDQEGGQVQVLHGSGFSSIPTGLAQGKLGTVALQADAKSWGAQLQSAGVTMNLAPVADLMGSAAAAAKNPPIGAFQREYGFTVSGVLGHVDAFRRGMTAAGVVPVLKHFPGLGYVTKNTDTSSGVVDSTISAGGANVGMYRSEIAAGASCIMVSSATYARIDPKAPGVFSPTMVTSVLRNQLGFGGVVLTDDLSGAAQVQAWSPSQRAILAIEAGVDIVLVSRTPTVAPQMVDAVVAKARTDPAFDKLVNAAARRVVTLKKAQLAG
jgi:beta-N-acetylhexosaminidase